jgi:hypothetical protein
VPGAAHVERLNRAAVLYAPGDLRVQERSMPDPGPHEVLVEVMAVGVCGSDVHYYEHGRIGARVVREPLVLGHETSARVIGLGAGATRHQGRRSGVPRARRSLRTLPGVPVWAIQPLRESAVPGRATYRRLDDQLPGGARGLRVPASADGLRRGRSADRTARGGGVGLQKSGSERRRSRARDGRRSDRLIGRSNRPRLGCCRGSDHRRQ